ncbi:MAG: twin-arginine translocase TatA/TatE family subunit [Desulfovibrio sp.]|jgi:sec-independent protein translocase protein TatB|nr:twin-arginine translocase TatA/TatE family subunit [Desulfovibrio sp.]
MLGIGTYEFLVIVVVAVLVLGPEHLPKVIRTVTRVMSDLRRINTEFQRTINFELADPPPKAAVSKKRGKTPAREASPDGEGLGVASGPEPSAQPAPFCAEQAQATGGEESNSRAGAPFPPMQGGRP